MGRITIINLSTFMDFSALARVACFMSGDEYAATHDEYGDEVARITRKGNTYTVLDGRDKNVSDDP